MTELTKKGVIINRINYYKSVISNTMLAIQKYKLLLAAKTRNPTYILQV